MRVRRGSSTVHATRTATGLVAVALLGIVGCFGVLLRATQHDAERALDDRFGTRSTLTAGFARDYVTDLAARERSQAERLLAGTNVDATTFEQVVKAFDFEAAVLLDNQGRLLQVWPPKPSILGTDMTARYDHLRRAVSGEIGVSEVVPSAADAVAVTAVAVPFDSAAGRRVLSGAFAPAHEPLGAYLRSVVPISGGTATLIDRSGHTLAGRSLPPQRFAALADGLTHTDIDGVATTVAVAGVDGTPWRVALMAPTAGMRAPLGGGRVWAPWVLLAVLAFTGALTLLLLVRLGRTRAQAILQSRTDELTGLANRRAVAEALERALAQSARHGHDLAVLMIDLDHFKAINDAFGHDGGDTALQAAASALRAVTRGGDLAGRWGGEEFIVLANHVDAAAAAAAAERIRTAIAAAVLPPDLRNARLTASIGIALLSDGGANLVERADAALYQAKRDGRDRCVFEHPREQLDRALAPTCPLRSIWSSVGAGQTAQMGGQRGGGGRYVRI